ncbi:MAG: hypothetical protein ACTSXL_02505 [Alphaproteobacteria bacterium]
MLNKNTTFNKIEQASLFLTSESLDRKQLESLPVKNLMGRIGASESFINEHPSVISDENSKNVIAWKSKKDSDGYYEFYSFDYENLNEKQKKILESIDKIANEKPKKYRYKKKIYFTKTTFKGVPEC